MRVLGAAVLIMESMIMGFALLLAGKGQSSLVIAFGAVIAVLFIVAGGMLKSRIGWILGSLLQIAAIGFGAFVTPSISWESYLAGSGFVRLSWGARARPPEQPSLRARGASRRFTY